MVFGISTLEPPGALVLGTRHTFQRSKHTGQIPNRWECHYIGVHEHTESRAISSHPALSKGEAGSNQEALLTNVAVVYRHHRGYHQHQKRCLESSANSQVDLIDRSP